jgi:hypothetical protein
MDTVPLRKITESTRAAAVSTHAGAKKAHTHARAHALVVREALLRRAAVALRHAVHLRHERLREREVVRAARRQQNEQHAHVTQLRQPALLPRLKCVREGGRQVAPQLRQRLLAQRQRRRGGIGMIRRVMRRARGERRAAGAARAGFRFAASGAQQRPHRVGGHALAGRGGGDERRELRKRGTCDEMFPAAAGRVAVAHVKFGQPPRVQRDVQAQWRLAARRAGRARAQAQQRERARGGRGSRGGIRGPVGMRGQRPAADERVARELQAVAAMRLRKRLNQRCVQLDSGSNNSDAGTQHFK